MGMKFKFDIDIPGHRFPAVYANTVEGGVKTCKEKWLDGGTAYFGNCARCVIHVLERGFEYFSGMRPAVGWRHVQDVDIDLEEVKNDPNLAKEFRYKILILTKKEQLGKNRFRYYFEDEHSRKFTWYETSVGGFVEEGEWFMANLWAVPTPSGYTVCRMKFIRYGRR
jgi:hypothetical protein